MIAYCPENSSETKRAIEKAGGKAHIINIAAGTQEDKKENISIWRDRMIALIIFMIIKDI